MADSFDPALAQDAVRHLQALLRIDTSNPPGNETPAAEYLAELLRAHRIEPLLLGRAPSRKCLVARLKGDGTAAPLLLSAHLDVVPAEAHRWRHPPFGGVIAEGYLWGRGAIDMKHMAVMAALCLARLKDAGLRLRRDLIFAAVADEEMGCDEGSRFLAMEHPELVRAEYALTEVGGFSLHLGGRRLYPIQVAEKGLAWLRMSARGTPGHGSMPRRDSALLRLAEAVARLGRSELPLHITPPAETYLRAVAATQPGLAGILLKGLTSQTLAPHLLRLLPDPSAARAIRAVLGNTASPTVFRAGTKTNVIPGEASCEIDGRLVAGQTAASLIQELRRIVGPGLEIEVLREAPAISTEPAAPIWDALCASLRRYDPEAVPVPYMIPGFTDAQAWTALGTRVYGFAPVRLPPDGPRFADLFHGDDERIPIDGLGFGISVLYEAVRRLCAGEG